MLERPRTLPGRLATEIARVATLRERYKHYARPLSRPQANFRPVIYLMGVALERAIAAVDVCDIAGQAIALVDLRGFADELPSDDLAFLSDGMSDPSDGTPAQPSAGVFLKKWASHS